MQIVKEQLTVDPNIPEVPFEDVVLEYPEDGMKVIIKPEHVITSIQHENITKNIPTTVWAYNGNRGSTFSGPYVFNPLQAPRNLKTKIKERIIQKGSLIQQVDTLY